MYIRHGVGMACAGAVGVILAGAPAAAAPSIDPALARAVTQHLALDDAPVIKVQREGRGGDRSESRGGRLESSRGRSEGRSEFRRERRDRGERRESRSSRRDYDEPRRDGREYRRRRDDGRRDRHRHRRDRDGSSIYLSIPFFDPYPYSYYSYGRVYGGGRCAVWRDRCAANWGYGNSNFYGCMRYYGCY